MTSTREPLLCLLDGRPVANLLDAGQGMAAVQYLDPVVEEHRGVGLLSVRLPVRHDFYPATDARAFLEGLVPEGWVRDQVAVRARLDRDDTFGLLAAFGRDCAGAVSVIRPDELPDRDDGVEWLDSEQLAARLRELRSAPFGIGAVADVRISLGGVQEKLVVVRRGDQFGLPLGSTPSTHLLKPVPLADDGTPRHPGLAEIEFFCMQLARAMVAFDDSRTTGLGFRVPDTELIEIGTRPAILVERYDRSARDDVMHRIHQEDGCQVLGILPGAKYQRGPDGPPSFRLIAQALDRWGADPILDQRALLQAIAFTVLCGNGDLHAKNLSFLHHDGFRLAPIYDVVSTRLYDNVDLEMGMRVGSATSISDVCPDDLLEEATSWGFGVVAGARALHTCARAALETMSSARAAVHARTDRHVQVDALVGQITERARILLSTTTPGAI